MLAWRRTLRAEDVLARSASIVSALRSWTPLVDAERVAAYGALSREPSMAALLKALLDRGVLVSLPLVERDVISLRRIAGLEDVCVSDGMPGPAPWCVEKVDPQDLDLILVPGLAFDPEGHRLGRGGGHYDRLLNQVRANCVRVGVCFHRQLVDVVPTEAWDQKVHWIATERGLVRCGGEATTHAGSER